MARPKFQHDLATRAKRRIREQPELAAHLHTTVCISLRAIALAAIDARADELGLGRSEYLVKCAMRDIEQNTYDGEI